ncbi:Tol-Pal system beta propeller repeat protein TolB [Lyticum sinuosum]|uniref:Tol-Pal system protein TolB n=1 Tax=Lyticum sinuosum TaxID=1332059 RepID=A0AAE5AHE6_9RICK|nr:Tol-Pal system beta propeller repeat protein TolB [Lyticum sinuosum]MDZ5760921.1 Protein TolB [Lyticum sinuosum]
MLKLSFITNKFIFNNIIKLLLIICIYSYFSLSKCFGILKIDVNKGHFEPLPIAIQTFTPINSESNGISSTLTKIVSDDLESSGLFKPINDSAFPEVVDFSNRPNFEKWRKINVNALLVGKVEVIPQEQAVKLMFRIWDVYSEKQLEAMIYKIKYTSWRRLAHKVADKIHYKITGDSGYFDSHIVYISETGSGKNRKKRLAIMDQDGNNLRYLSDDNNIVITPRFDPKNNRIAYMSYYKRVPQVFVIDILTGIKTKIGDFQGMSFAPRFAPDGKTMAMSVAKNGSTSIYEVDILNKVNGGGMRRLTNDNGTISTSPSYSPDSSKIVYSSDREGRSQLYIMNRDGTNSYRISSGDGTYATPVWSPRGDYIVFTKIKSGQFFIGIIKPDGTDERIMTSSWLEEGPDWAPNGRAIIFTRQERGKGSKICAIDITGYGERIINTETSASDPAWSPLLP